MKITNLEFGRMIQAAAAKLSGQAEYINSLNVFPVPDGDTGTNMSMSMASGAKYERETISVKVGDLAASLAKGLLMGARGNSGVILSQIFRGFAKGCQDLTVLDAVAFANAYANGAKVAYKAVMKPTEGTILTVVRASAQAGLDAVRDGDKDLVKVVERMVRAADATLARTPDLLPVLKEVGVVDSGGQGLAFVLRAFYEALTDQVIEETIPDVATMNEMVNINHHQNVQGRLNPEDISYRYCTQIMIQINREDNLAKNFDYDAFRDHLAELGDSLLVINDDEVVKVHIHTEHPDEVIGWGLQFGDLRTVKVDNMRWQQQKIMNCDNVNSASSSTLADESEVAKDNDTAVIAVASGAGVSKLLISLGVTQVIDGGQTMNPNTEDLVRAINGSGAQQALILPNNSNIFMVADQAAQVASIPTRVVFTRTIAQGMSALLSYNPEKGLAENQAAMEANLANVKSGEVAIAVRDTTVNGWSISKGDFMGIVDSKIVAVDLVINRVVEDMIAKMLDKDSEVVTILYGVDGSKEVAEQIAALINEVDEEIDVQIYDGGQPIYSYLIAVE